MTPAIRIRPADEGTCWRAPMVVARGTSHTTVSLPGGVIDRPPIAGLRSGRLRCSKALAMERVFRLTCDLACMWEENDLPAGTLVMEPRCVACEPDGEGEWMFLASVDEGRTWREYRTVIEDVDEWFEPVRKKEDELAAAVNAALNGC